MLWHRCWAKLPQRCFRHHEWQLLHSCVGIHGGRNGKSLLLCLANWHSITPWCHIQPRNFKWLQFSTKKFQAENSNFKWTHCSEGPAKSPVSKKNSVFATFRCDIKMWVTFRFSEFWKSYFFFNDFQNIMNKSGNFQETLCSKWPFLDILIWNGCQAFAIWHGKSLAAKWTTA